MHRCHHQGDPHKLVYGSDYLGRPCGADGRGDQIYYPRITEDLLQFAVDNAGKKPTDINPLHVRRCDLCLRLCACCLRLGVAVAVCE